MLTTQVCRITHHPIACYSKKAKEQYVIGLGNVLFRLSNGHPDMRLLFEQWGYSIIHQDVSAWFQYDDETSISRAIALHRIGWYSFRRLKHQFYFDCFYLTETYNKSRLNSLYDFLKKSGSNIFTKSALEKTYKYFVGGSVTLKVEDSLLNHRNENIVFSSKIKNRVIVVATVSAGKSTLINALTGHFFNRASNGVCTTRVCKIHNKPIIDGITLRTNDSFLYGSEPSAYSSEVASEVGFHFESMLGSHKVCIIDTPGVNNAEDSEHFKITEKEIKAQNYDCVIFVSNGLYNGTNDEARLLNLLHSEVKKPIIFVLNQLDRFNSKRDDISKMIRDYTSELAKMGFKTPKIFPLSAQYALLLRNETQLHEEEANELESMRKRFSKPFFDLQHYSGSPSVSELEKSGIILLEKEIIKHLK